VRYFENKKAKRLRKSLKLKIKNSENSENLLIEKINFELEKPNLPIILTQKNFAEIGKFSLQNSNEQKIKLEKFFYNYSNKQKNISGFLPNKNIFLFVKNKIVDFELTKKAPFASEIILQNPEILENENLKKNLRKKK